MVRFLPYIYGDTFIVIIIFIIIIVISLMQDCH